MQQGLGTNAKADFFGLVGALIFVGTLVSMWSA